MLIWVIIIFVIVSHYVAKAGFELPSAGIVGYTTMPDYWCFKGSILCDTA